MDHLLYLLWSVRERRVSIKELSELMALSDKQVIRKLKRWEIEGWFIYSPGRGRGHLSKIEWKKDLENTVLNDLTVAIQSQNYSGLNTLDFTLFSEVFQHKIMELVAEQLVTKQQEERGLLTIQIYSKNLGLNPLRVNDAENGWIMSHIYSRLLYKTDKGEYIGDLVHHWKRYKYQFVFYVRPRLFWHDGDPVLIEEIVNSISTSFGLQKFSSFHKKLGWVRKETDFSFSIEYKGEENELLLLLSQIDFSLTKTNKPKIGTGSYKIEKHEEGLLTLVANEKYHLAQALINRLQFVTIPSSLGRKMESTMKQNDKGLQANKELAGIVSAYINPRSHKLQDEKIRKYIIGFLKHFANRVERLDELKVSLWRDVYLPSTVQTTFLRIGYIINQAKFVHLLDALCSDHGLDVEIVKYNIDDDIDILAFFNSVDILIMGEYPIEDELDIINRYDKQHPLSVILNSMNQSQTWSCQLYESYRRIYYPSEFQKSNSSIYGYPELSRSWLL
ncbi:ABC transporter substrate-binding protein [Lysinibacillus sp. 54212]|uniref:ABC transporter substrate-binding protein n=1 Tax=Lysinibacillus sp. 54212 TaxID=3119829 RepID=UPI002FCC92EE